MLPTLVVDGRATPVLHVTQIAEALGIPPPPSGSPRRDGVEAAAVLDAWIGIVRGADWEAVLAPTPARGRSVRNLTVNVFHPFELLPPAWSSGEFPWQPEDDGVREQQLATPEELLRFAGSAAADWRSFLDHEYLEASDPPVSSLRGPLRFSALVSFQRWHAAYHYRQLVHVLGGDLALLDGLVLPREVF